MWQALSWPPVVPSPLTHRPAGLGNACPFFISCARQVHPTLPETASQARGHACSLSANRCVCGGRCLLTSHYSWLRELWGSAGTLAVLFFCESSAAAFAVQVSVSGPVPTLTRCEPLAPPASLPPDGLASGTSYFFDFFDGNATGLQLHRVRFELCSLTVCGFSCLLLIPLCMFRQQLSATALRGLASLPLSSS